MIGPTLNAKDRKGNGVGSAGVARFAFRCGGRLLAAVPLLAQDGQWLMYSGSYSSHRFSPLKQISTDNVAKLRPAWVYQPPGTGSVESTPVVANGVMYVTSGPTMVAALDLKSGKALWEWTRPIAPSVLNLGFPRVNRGVAVLDNMVYVGTLDGYLFALDARAGHRALVGARRRESDRPLDHRRAAGRRRQGHRRHQRRRSRHPRVPRRLRREDRQAGVALLHDPLARRAGQRGVAGRQLGARRRRDVADRFVRSGARSCSTGAPAIPARTGTATARKGDNLYTSSLVAIDVDTGKPRWHFQFTPHDVHDWDANQIPVLVDTQVGGRARQLVVMANRNGFFYALDRKTGEFVFGTPYAKQTWAKGLDERGRPIEIPGMEPSEKGTLVYPSLQGSTNWASPSYSPATDMLYVPVREMGSVYYKTGVEYKPGTYYTGGSEKRLDEESWGAVRALDVKTGKQAWDFKLPTPTWAGVMATAGGLVFSGSNEGNFYALDATSGKPLWQFQTGGAIRSGPMSFLAGDKQYVAVAGGHALFVFGLDQ